MHQRENQANIGFKDMTCCVTAEVASACKALNPCTRRSLRPQNCRAHDALRATSWGHPSCPVPGKRKLSTPPLASSLPSRRLRDGDVATGDVHVLGKDGTCAHAAASLNRCLYQCPPKQLPKPYEPETLNPETESGTSGAGPGPGPLYTPPATREWETEQTCELCGQTPPSTLRRFLCEWRSHKHMRYMSN